VCVLVVLPPLLRRAAPWIPVDAPALVVVGSSVDALRPQPSRPEMSTR
jgi:hypothetical protein